MGKSHLGHMPYEPPNRIIVLPICILVGFSGKVYCEACYVVSRGQTTNFLQGVIACSISAYKRFSSFNFCAIASYMVVYGLLQHIQVICYIS